MTNTPYSFDATRRVGPVSQGERLTLARLFAACPRPLGTMRVIDSAPRHLFSELMIGFAHLEQRGWVRIRGRRAGAGGTRWDLTSRIERDMPIYARPEVRRELIEEVEAEVSKQLTEMTVGKAAAAAAAPSEEVQRQRMGVCLAFSGWHAYHGEEVVSGYLESELRLFDALLDLAVEHGAGRQRAEKIRASARASDQVTHELVDLADEACEDIPLEPFKALLDRRGRTAWLTGTEERHH